MKIECSIVNGSTPKEKDKVSSNDKLVADSRKPYEMSERSLYLWRQLIENNPNPIVNTPVPKPNVNAGNKKWIGYTANDWLFGLDG